MWEYPRHTAGTETIPFHALYNIFLMRYQRLEISKSGFEGQKYIWPEYGCYIGVGLLGFFLIANIINVLSIRKNLNKIPLMVCFVVLFLLFLGDFHRFAPYTILKKIPIFISTHVSGRFLIVITFIASLLSFPLSQWVENVLNNPKKKAIKNLFTVIIIIFSCAIILDLVYVNTVCFLETFRVNPKEINYASNEFSHKYEYQFINALPPYSDMTRTTMYPALKMNIATICGIHNNPPKKGFDSNKPLVFSQNIGAKISNLKFTPNKIYFSAENSVKSTIFLNQNYVRGWKFSLSEFPVKNINNKLAVEMEKGTYKNVYFYYFPDSIIIGVLLTIIGIFISWLVIKFRLKLLL